MKTLKHYDWEEKRDIIIHHVGFPYLIDDAAEIIAKHIDYFSFDMLKELAKAITIIAKGKY